jgi:hypothetical protein
MNKQILFSIAFVFLLIGCKKEGTPTETPVSEETQSAPPRMECYTYDANGSTIDLQLQYNGEEVTGSLTYNLAEKDSNKGTITGKVENNILIAEYTFYSEGTESTRQVAFKISANKLVEGYGEMTEDGTHFKNVNNLSFDSKMPLSKIDCTQ